jgi:FkbM family methyltransferase
LYDVKAGFYIDIGANDPIIDSVTNFFYIRGWNGINIEPLKDKYALLKNKRPRDINLNVVAGQENGNATLYINKGLTTTIKNYTRPRRPKVIVNVETMTDICKKYVPKGTIIEFCKIDVEGAERKVLLGYDFINYRPKIFCIESTLPGTRIPSYQLFEDILIQNNYSFIYQYDVNRFYVDNKSIFTNIIRQRVVLIDLFIEKYKKKCRK